MHAPEAASMRILAAGRPRSTTCGLLRMTLSRHTKASSVAPRGSSPRVCAWWWGR